MFADWHPRAFESYLSHGLRDREDGRVELACSGEVEAAIFEHTGGVDVMAAALGVAAPTWVVRAGRGYLPADLFEELCRHLPAGRYLELDGGHLLPMEAPDRVAELLEKHPYVQAFRLGHWNEGGDGVTIATLAPDEEAEERP